jgi:hypothetical protein
MNILYKYSIILIFSFAVVVFILLFFISAPYGKFSRKGWGPSIKSKWAWTIMEFPSPFLMALFFITADIKTFPEIIFLILWLTHYIQRTFIYPFSQAGREKPYPLIVASMAIIFNCLNGFANGFGVFNLYSYNTSWLLTGYIINKTADWKFRSLRKNNPGEYVIPRGWLFNYISSPHYFGEIIEWAGWAIMTWSLPGLAFSVFTFANLFPRAVASHRWYKKYFPEYPRSRKAIIPFII